MGDDWTRLGRLIRQRRKALGMRSQVDLAVASGIGRSTIQKLEWGTASPERKTMRMVEEALRWQEGSVTAVLAGGDPTPTAQDADAETERIWRREPTAPGDLSQLIRNIVFEAVIGTNPDTPASKIREIEERADRLAREAGYTVARERRDTHTEEDPAP